MCGICGFLGQGDSEVLKVMRDRMTHRGPDDQGLYYEPGIGLGHRRLSIIDLSSGHQPMSNETGQIQIVFNGEIYNFRSLRNELEEKGHQFSSTSDTEAIIHAYEEWGPACVERLRGMFAFAIWDDDSRTLFLARDRIGIKPLYYAHSGETLIFASEIKALLAHPLVRRDLDLVALDLLLRLQYSPAPHTIFQQIRKLPPACWLIHRDGHVKVKKYWEHRFVEAERTEEEWLDSLEDKLLETVESHLISDVPLGAFLSGGIDSSLVVLTMSRIMKEPVKTFSIGFESSDFDERKFACEVARRASSDHSEEEIAAGIDAQLFSSLVEQLDEPMSDLSSIPTFYVSRLARRSVTVVLSGDGGDESFAGYDKYRNFLDWQRTWGAIRLPSWIGHWARVLPAGRRTVEALCRGPLSRFAELSYGFYSADLERLYTDSTRDQLVKLRDYTDPWVSLEKVLKAKSQLSRIQHADFLTYLPDDILLKVDRMSMLNSLEVRVPLLDHEFQELAARVPTDLKLHSGIGKYILKQLLDRWGLPDDLVHRRKTGFSPTLSFWLSDGWLPFAIDQVRQGWAVKAGLFDAKVIESECANQKPIRLFNLWCLEIWGRKHFN